MSQVAASANPVRPRMRSKDDLRVRVRERPFAEAQDGRDLGGPPNPEDIDEINVLFIDEVTTEEHEEWDVQVFEAVYEEMLGMETYARQAREDSWEVKVRRLEEKRRENEEEGHPDESTPWMTSLLPLEEYETEAAEDPRRRKLHSLPTVEEQRRHSATHLPYRPWCPYCVAARKPGQAHQVQAPRDLTAVTPEIHVDYAFFKDSGAADAVSLPVVVVKDRDTRAVAAHACPYKGGNAQWVVQQVCRDLNKWGLWGSVILKCDQELALVDLVNNIVRAREGQPGSRTIVEHSPVGESSSNGVIESGVKSCEGMTRTLRLQLQARIQQDVSVHSPIFSWLLEHASNLLTWYGRGRDGKTPYERLKGKPLSGEMLEFGVQVMHRVVGKVQGGVMAARWTSGTWLGRLFAFGEHLVATADGRTYRTRSVHEQSEERQWSAEAVLGVKGCPWEPTGTMRQKEAGRPTEPTPEVQPPLQPAPEPVPRGVRITADILKKYGYTEKCSKCKAMRTGDATQPTLGHSAECRERIKELSRGDPELKKKHEEAEERKVKFIVRMGGEAVEESQQETHEETEEHQRKRGRVSTKVEEEGHREGQGGSSSSSSQPSPAPRPDTATTTDGGGGDFSVPSAESTSKEPEHPAPEMSQDSEPVVTLRKRAISAGDEELVAQRPRVASLPQKDEVELLAEEVPRRARGCQPKGTPPEPQRTPTPKEKKYLICEVYSPPRVTSMARQMGHSGGWNLDPTVEDALGGQRWDLLDQERFEHACRRLRRDRPEVLILYPPCVSSLTVSSLSKAPREEIRQEGEKLMLKALELCRIQRELGGVYVLEHPKSSHAWGIEAVKDFMGKSECCSRSLHRIAYGTKPSIVLSNNGVLVELLAARCDGECRPIHRQTRATEQYSDEFCRAVVKGALLVREERMSRAWRHKPCKNMITGMRNVQFAGVVDEDIKADQVDDMCDPVDDAHLTLDYVDARTGEELQPKLVRDARMEEMRCFQKLAVYSHASISCMRATPNWKLIGVTWVDVNKGSAAQPKYRSRLCAQEFANSQEEDLFAATPPLLAAKLLVSECACGGGNLKMMIMDVKRAFLYGKVRRPIFIRLPAEDPMSKVPNMVGRLEKAMYGTRDAPALWQAEVRSQMEALGFEVSPAYPCVYFHRKKNVRIVAHVDDFLCLGPRAGLEWVYSQLQREFELTREILGDAVDELREAHFLGRTLRWTARGIEWEGDSKHSQILIEEWGSLGMRAVVSPVTKEDLRRPNREELSNEESRRYRRAAARLNYMSLDRADLGFAAKEASRCMSKPCRGDLVRIRRAVQYLIGCPRAVNLFSWQNPPERLEVLVDSDWAGCDRTRRSTSGGVMMRGSHCLQTWSRTQATVALSSGEAELNASIKGMVEGHGVRTLCKFLGLDYELVIKGDSVACRGTLNRDGVGKQKHLETRQLWAQEQVQRHNLSYVKIPREINSSDCLTHPWTPREAYHFLEMGLLRISADRQENEPAEACFELRQVHKQEMIGLQCSLAPSSGRCSTEGGCLQSYDRHPARIVQ